MPDTKVSGTTHTLENQESLYKKKFVTISAMIFVKQGCFVLREQPRDDSVYIVSHLYFQIPFHIRHIRHGAPDLKASGAIHTSTGESFHHAACACGFEGTIEFT